MVPFELPKSAEVNRVIPKNLFHPKLSTAQRKTLTSKVERITWTHVLKPETTNLPADEIKEIQVIHVKLRERDEMKGLRQAMEKIIPYTLVFWFEFNGEAFLSSSKKHGHAIAEDSSVLDWNFTSDWFPVDGCPYTLNLVGSLDDVAKRLWFNLSGNQYDAGASSISQLTQDLADHCRIEREIAQLEQKIKREKQFNRKVELNMRLAELRLRLQA